MFVEFWNIALTNHLGDSGMNNKPGNCNRYGTIPESKSNAMHFSTHKQIFFIKNKKQKLARRLVQEPEELT